MNIPAQYLDLSADELRDLPTLATGQIDSLKIDNGDGWRVWISRGGVEDGLPYDNGVMIEHYDGNRWETVHEYEAGAPSELEDENEDDEDDDDGYSWSDASALWQIQHGNEDTPRTDSARAYLEARLAGEIAS